MNYKDIALGGLAILALVFGYLYFSGSTPPFGSPNPGGPAHFQQEAFLQGATFGGRNQSYFDNAGKLTIGASGTAQVNQVVTTCSMVANNASVGSTTQYAYCSGVTGVTSADTIDASFSTSSTLLNDQWAILGAKASTTAGSIDFRLYNLTGVAASKSMSGVSTIGSTTNISAGH